MRRTKALINSSAIKELEEMAKTRSEYNKCLEHIRRLRCLIYDENLGNRDEISKLAAKLDDTKNVILITEVTNNDRNSIPKSKLITNFSFKISTFLDVFYYSSLEYYQMLINC